MWQTPEVHADILFAQEDNKGYALKGFNTMRPGVQTPSDDQVWHLLEGVAQSQNNVVRCTFIVDLFAVTCAGFNLVLLLVALQKVASGPASIGEAKRLREEGGWMFRSVLVTDSTPLFQAICSHTLKVRSKRSLAPYLFWLGDCRCKSSQNRYGVLREACS